MISQTNIEERDYSLESYDYLLDPSLIASKPSAIRHESRLMIVRNSVLEEDCLTNKFTKNLLDEFREGDLVVVNSMNDLLDKYGEIPLPPYIKNTEEESFHENSYQTEYATNPGAVAAPTAGLHLSKSLISNLKKKGVIILPITLHVGYGTFKPIDQEDLSNLKLHKEWVSVNKEVVEEIKRIKKTDRKIIAIGTTSVRNFHLPKSSLLLLVSAMIGRERLLDLYKKAIKEKFRFFSYGDAMYISPDSLLEKNRFRL